MEMVKLAIAIAIVENNKKLDERRSDFMDTLYKSAKK